ncbi:Arylsulfatase [Maioricimonas rarisocia]|uniref:Arylsulfatase n=1 Tax=Maioricimonas rarisocia TaxID=2528026 RepID=A0A517Z9X5_9PLAN|nr:sulfatase [Maioricimonas rarisocia]QDU39292.1 Arylsulfatase [Maioricimonas rarisocia]
MPSKTKPTRSRLLLAGLLFVAAVAVQSTASAADRPNVLVILCDDLGYGDLACYGHETIKTPHLDKLAAEGVRLTDCYSASPLCSPARAGLLTGRTPSRSGIYSWIAPRNPMYLKQDETTIATILKGAGYDTCHVGKWHLNGLFNHPKQTQPDDHGFDYWFSTQNNASPTHRNPKNFVRNGEPVGELEGFSCQIVANEGIGWLKSRGDTDKPFFLHVCFHEPHEPIDSPQELVDDYPDANRRGEALYYANVANMDRAVGSLMQALDELDVVDDTLVVFTSDNGPETLNRYSNAWRSHGSPGPLRGMKLHIYEGGIRVPGILRWPGRIEAGSESSEPVCSVDLLPTICELTDLPLPKGKPLDGASLVPLLEDKPVKRTKPLFWHYYGAFHNRQVAIREGDWKLVAGWDQTPDMPTGGSLKPGIVDALKRSELKHFELYNLREDLAEEHDLADSEPERLQRMAEQARQLYQEVIAEGPNWEFPAARGRKQN